MGCCDTDRATGDEYIDFVSQVLAAANELLLDKLKLICSAVLRSFGPSRLSPSLFVPY